MRPRSRRTRGLAMDPFGAAHQTPERPLRVIRDRAAFGMSPVLVRKRPTSQ
jgi:hypothetical protein